MYDYANFVCLHAAIYLALHEEQETERLQESLVEQAQDGSEVPY